MKRLLSLALLLVPMPLLAAPAATALDAQDWLIRGTFDKPQPDGNSLVIAGRDGVLVFDTGRHPEHTASIVAAVHATGKPLVAVVNSHWHLDHVSGNAVLRRIAPHAQVYASDAIDAATTGFLARSAASARTALASGGVPPDIAAEMRGDLATFDHVGELRPTRVVRGTTVLQLGGRSIELHLAHRAATAGDVWLYDSARRRVATGDLVTLPAPFLDTACPEGWSRALAGIAATPFVEAIPGHGPPMDRLAFTTWRDAYDRFVACARGPGDVAGCAAGWRRDAAPLLGNQAALGERMAAAYAGQIRAGALDRYCGTARD